MDQELSIEVALFITTVPPIIFWLIVKYFVKKSGVFDTGLLFQDTEGDELK